MYTVLFDRVILKSLWLHNPARFIVFNSLSERPASAYTGAVTSTVDKFLMCDSLKSND